MYGHGGDSNVVEWVVWYCWAGTLLLAHLGWGIAGGGVFFSVGVPASTVVAVGLLVSAGGWVAFSGLGYLMSGDDAKMFGVCAFGVGNALVAGAVLAPVQWARILVGTLAVGVVLVGWMTVKTERIPVVRS